MPRIQIHHIEEVRASKDEGNKVSIEKILFSKDEIVQDINSNSMSLVTIFLKNDKWQQGRKVIVERINNEYYIKTEAIPISPSEEIRHSIGMINWLKAESLQRQQTPRQASLRILTLILLNLGIR
ncbi:hypothetical protein E4665_09970 [Sporolactobacillus shoreae]|uniref:Uncharacterized protein n=1 Tax=Sporolactobacillus shoreae TaxID=1465501 RepID=A0A4Z0GLW9_9BACL|nr:hypothetical protein [Sporolactobacillus shoreae]TGA97983.1 hypothetical protein E4665_09970 [Sporolactobacillus shoreae]